MNDTVSACQYCDRLHADDTVCVCIANLPADREQRRGYCKVVSAYSPPARPRVAGRARS